MGVRKRLEEIPIRVAGKHIAVTDALRAYVGEKLAKLPRYFDQVREAQVVFSVARDRNQGRGQAVEITVWCDGLVLRAEEASADMYASIDGAAEKLERQIEKYRSRMIGKRRLDETRRRRITKRSAVAALKGSPEAEGAAAAHPEIVRRKRFPMKPMTVEDAVVQMELLDHAFFVFRHAGSEQINVLYRRRDGNYGLIEPE